MVARRRTYEILIADDDPGFRETLKLVLEPYFHTVEAESGEEAIEIVERRPVDLALFDMHMHVLTGLEALRIIRERHVILPCILITADATEALRRDAVEAYSVLQKPVSKSELVQTVSTALVDAYDEGSPLW